MRREVEQDFNFGRTYIPHMKQIIGTYLIGEAPPDEDMRHNTDLIVLKLDSIRIACRVRRQNYLQYADEFTIRSGRPSGVTTELAKLIEGWGDYMIYGFAGSNAHMCSWVLGDLKVFRRWYVRELACHHRLPGQSRRNRDASSDFFAFKIDELPAEFVIARQLPPAMERPVAA